jgi:hypothetical protein
LRVLCDMKGFENFVRYERRFWEFCVIRNKV